jgi:hypothetical protein
MIFSGGENGLLWGSPQYSGRLSVIAQLKKRLTGDNIDVRMVLCWPERVVMRGRFTVSEKSRNGLRAVLKRRCFVIRRSDSMPDHIA